MPQPESLSLENLKEKKNIYIYMLSYLLVNRRIVRAGKDAS